MKSTTAYYLVLIYTLAMCKPILPLVQDEIAHFFWEAEHIATVHQHHGDHHAEEEIAAATDEEEGDKAPATSKTSEPVSPHLIVHSIDSFPSLLTEVQNFGARTYRTSSLTLDKHFPPPRSY